ncbi:MBL fold metallo-hydrolase [Criblamydia sequanensis]|uniref:Metallo-beta-lactamase domain-containing protein n=1 Tax=Candidatus Criblamydia sequanensis CRIB-18 TaxID=1437425 RepID=A0A090D3C5_9BACT|nr:MBL fold metallo-hydrolase [Criblamydia sequanensis]CDR35143.1 Conserved hypothetical protein [Criblamydia sequanensis CRIB-18]
MPKFKNPFIEDTKKTLWRFLKWRFTRRENNNGFEEIPAVKIDLEAIYHPIYENQVLWIGHSTLLIQCEGINILTDPVFSNRCSPLAFAGPKRLVKPALSLKELPKIDYVLISHNHYDHLDEKTVKFLGNNPKWLIPLGLKKWFLKRHITNLVELDWWQSYKTKRIEFFCLPAQHWSKRRIRDDFKTLWASWAIFRKDHRFWFAGDTGYNPYQFKEIGRRLGPFDFSAIPIGGYQPRWFMRKYHINPEEAVRIHLEVQSKLSLGIHWGTFKLTDEPILEPPLELEKARKKWHLRKKDFVTLPVGEILKI